NTPTVVRGCGDLKLEATVKPAAVKVAWDVQRAADDHKSLTGLPTHADNGGDRKRKVTCNATGSFHVFAFVDANGNGKHSDHQDGVTVNLNIVEIKVKPGVANNKIVTNPNFSATIGTGLRVDSGTSKGFGPAVGAVYTDAEFTKQLIGMHVAVTLAGGG